ncbi:MAG: tetratricopeptide repeat protein, partial [Acidobacteria bacterium]|nr:tetratricopeptide repeat protein [Acidobacteriota bacterium]
VDAKAPTEIRDKAYLELAVVQFESQRFDDAIKTVRAFQKVQTKGESIERARLLAGQAYYLQGNLLGAVNELRNFKATYPNSPLIRDVNVFLPQVEEQLQKSK